MLKRKGVPFAIGTGFEGYVPKTRVLRYEAAVAAVTIDAARLLGIEKTHGSVEVGKAADLVLYDGDCFENATHVTNVIVGGRVAYDRAEEQAVPVARRMLPLGGGGEPGCCLGAW